MFFILGSIVVIGCVLGGYIAAGGHLHVLWQPFEFVIIIGAALGGFIIGNPGNVMKSTIQQVMGLFGGDKYGKDAYVELLTMMYSVFKIAKTKGVLGLESHIEDPHNSELFNKFPFVAHDHHAMVFFTDYLRLVTMGTTNPYQMEDLMNLEMEAHHKETHQFVKAITTIADGMPALGIVAAVLGVIHTMGSISEPPEVLGHLIGAALVGTFTGVLIAYGFVSPVAVSVESRLESQSRYLECMKVGILAYLQGHAPSVAVEFARKGIFHDVRPTFAELEEKLQNAPTI